MTWTVETLNDVVDAELSALPNDMKAKFVWISNLITEHGLEKVGKPYVKYLEKGLWEIKLDLRGEMVFLRGRRRSFAAAFMNPVVPYTLRQSPSVLSSFEFSLKKRKKLPEKKLKLL